MKATDDRTAPSADWVADCQRWRGRLLSGRFAHWCNDWDMLPVDETTPEFDCCTCYTTEERANAKADT